MDETINNLYTLFDAAFEENMNGRGTDITRMVTTFVPDAIQNLQAYEAIFKNNIKFREDIANAVEEKMTYMCGCRNCIEKVKMIINDDVKPFDSQCANCELECDARST